MSKINVPRFSELLRRLLQQSGSPSGEPVAGELAPEVSAVLTLEQERPEWEFLKNQRLRNTGVNATGDATHPAQFQVRNPAGSNTLCILNEIRFGSTSAAPVVINYGWVTVQADLGTINSSSALDTRFGITGTAGVLVASQQINLAAVAIALFVDSVTPIGVTLPVIYTKMPIIMAPGTRLLFQSAANNQNIAIMIQWLERPMAKYEST